MAVGITKKFTKTETAPFTGTTNDDVITGNDLGVEITGGGSSAGNESVVGDLYYVTKNVTVNGGEGNDTFVINTKNIGAVVLHGGTSLQDNAGNAAAYTDADGDGVFVDSNDNPVSLSTEANARLAQTDVRLNVAYRPTATPNTVLSTQATTVAGYNAVDTIEFKVSGDFSELTFDGIERVELASGVSITLSAEAFEINGNVQDRGFLNPGVHFYGVAGGAKETVRVNLEYAENTFTPASSVVGGSPVDYLFADFQLDDYSVADIFTNINVVYNARDLGGDDDEDESSDLPQYVRIDGSNNSETVQGSDGVDNATLRLGDDTYFGNDGNDLIIGHGGADYLNGGAGNDIFVIGGFGSGNQGTSSKADDGLPEWIATGSKHDVIVGGTGIDTLRITTGIGATNATTGKVLLNDANFQSMEVVQVGGTVGRVNVEDSALQLINNHFYLNTTGLVSDTSSAAGNNGGSINNVVVDASGVTKNGLRFEGNANTQTFIGTTKNDTFVGNGGNDTLTGGAGSDIFAFGKVHIQTVTGAATAPQAYADVAVALTGKDTITDFTVGTDKIGLNRDMFTMFTKTTGVVVGNVVSAAGAVALDSNDYLLFDTTTKTLNFDADGSGSGAAVELAVLTGVTALSASDFVIL